MRRILIVALIWISQTAFSQDTIVKKNNELVAAKILEVSTTQIKFKKWNNQDGPAYFESLSEITSIKYANGTVDTFKVEAQINPVVSSEVPANPKQSVEYIPFNVSSSGLLDIIDNSPPGETRDKLRMMHKDMSNYQTYQYLATGLGYGIGFAVPIVVTYRTIFDVYNPNYFQSIMAGAIVGAAIRITGAVIAKVNKNKRLHKKDEIIAICNQLR